MKDTIEEFVNDLEGQLLPRGLWNMYAWRAIDDLPMAPQMRVNLLYDELEKTRDLPFALIGLAPGYAGARVSGLPFKDEVAAGVRLSTRAEPWSEPTSRAVERTLRNLGVQAALWNVLPFHPYEEGRSLSNRTPSSNDLKVHGYPWLSRFLRLMLPGTVIPVGRAAEAALRSIEIPDGMVLAPYVRHPSYGGESMFFKGIYSVTSRG